jgi:hypothetical protein
MNARWSDVGRPRGFRGLAAAPESRHSADRRSSLMWANKRHREMPNSLFCLLNNPQIEELAEARSFQLTPMWPR